MAKAEVSSTLLAEQLKAAGDLLIELASTLKIAVDLAHEAVQSSEPTGQMIALAAMLSQAGAMADRAGGACGCAGVQEQDTWLLSPHAADKLRLLVAGHAPA
jgi:hypothetical protein